MRRNVSSLCEPSSGAGSFDRFSTDPNALNTDKKFRYGSAASFRIFSRFRFLVVPFLFIIGAAVMLLKHHLNGNRVGYWKLWQESSLPNDGMLLNWSDTEADIASMSRRQEQWRNATSLIIVAGHAIYTGHLWTPQALRNERNWFLEPYQMGMVDTFIAHIRRGVELAAQDSSALLLFSGGETRPGVGPRSEASTYWLVADAFDWYGSRHSVQNRSHAEDYARDSYENLLFSICRFRQLSGNYPRHITVVSFGYKKPRFEMIHRHAMRFPQSRFHFVGIDPPATEGMRDSLSARERAKSMGPFARDPYGCLSMSLRSKRIERNPFLRHRPYPLGCPELVGLFRHCRPSTFEGALPWDASSSESSS